MHMLSELDIYDDSRHRAGTPYNYSTRVLAWWHATIDSKGSAWTF